MIHESTQIALTKDDLWILIAAVLVFFMQAGFKVFETGLVKKEHRNGIGAKNLIDWVAGSVAFYFIGFGIMFGDSYFGLVGLNLGATEQILDQSSHGWFFFLFQLGFAGTALTIVSGAMSGRTALVPYFVASLLTATFIYPVFGHWCWGNILNSDNQSWLYQMGFIDFAGSTVVHSLGAWVGLVGIWFVGPRLGRYDQNGRINSSKGSDHSYSILGVMILWLSWWGFNGGSTLSFNSHVPLIILNTNMAGSGGAISSMFFGLFFQPKSNLIEKIMGGTLTGLVAITACCHVVSPESSLIIGLCAGVIYNTGSVLLAKRLKIDDPVGAIAVHGFGGVFGTLSVALFGKEELLMIPRMSQLGVQALGITICFIFTTGLAFVAFYVLKKTIGLRVSAQHEKAGLFFNVDEDHDPTSESEENRLEVTLHQVSAKVSDRGYNLYTIQEYLNLSVDHRTTWEEADRIQYLSKDGAMIPNDVAMKQLKSFSSKMIKE